MLREYEETYLWNPYVKGKFGSSQPSKSSKVLRFHTEDKQETDRLLEVLRVCVQKADPTQGSSINEPVPICIMISWVIGEPGGSDGGEKSRDPTDAPGTN